MTFEALKVGELAKRTGLTVRTLHHYDEIGLLKPSLHTETRYRLYTAADVARLQQVLSLRQLGFSLDEIRECLDRRDFSPLEVIRQHVARLREQMELQYKLCERLESLARQFDTAQEVSADEFLQTIEVMTMIEKYYTPEQLAQLQQRRQEAGPADQELIQQAPQLWADLFTDVRAAMAAGTEPADPQARELAQRWLTLIKGFTGGDPGIFNSLRNMYDNESHVAGMDVKAMQPVMEYIQHAATAAGIQHPVQ